MLTADYQEFANRVRSRYPWQYRDLWHSHGEKFTKSTERGATATPQTGTKAELWSQARAPLSRFRPYLPIQPSV